MLREDDEVFDTTYIEQYMEYTATHEAPDNFHMWCAISSAGFALGRDCFIQMPFYTTYPNFYTILVAGSGACRKGGAISVMRDLITHAIKDRADRKFLPGKVYPEALIQQMGTKYENPDAPPKHASFMLFSPELGSFMSRHMQAMNMPDLLMELHDCPSVHEHITKNRGADTIHDAFLCLVGATTPKWMQTNMNMSMLSEGFIARTILVYGAHPKPRLTQEEQKRILPNLMKIRLELIAKLKHLSTIKGEFKLSPEAEQLWDDWYINFQTDQMDIADESGFSQRQHAHVLRTALVFAACAETDKIIHAPHLQAAINLLNQVRINMHIPLATAEYSDNMKGTARVLSLLKESGRKPMALETLARKLIQHMSPDDILSAIANLRQAGRIERLDLPSRNDDKIRPFYRLVEYSGQSDTPVEPKNWDV